MYRRLSIGDSDVRLLDWGMSWSDFVVTLVEFDVVMSYRLAVLVAGVVALVDTLANVYVHECFGILDGVMVGMTIDGAYGPGLQERFDLAGAFL